MSTCNHHQIVVSLLRTHLKSATRSCTRFFYMFWLCSEATKESNTSDIHPKIHCGSFFSTFSSLGYPWDLKIIVRGRIRFGIGCRIDIWAILEALGTRNAPRIEEMKIVFRLRQFERIVCRTFQKSTTKNTRRICFHLCLILDHVMCKFGLGCEA